MTRKCAYLLWLAALLLVGGTQASAQTAGTGGSLSSSPAAEEGTGLIVSIVKAGGVEFSEQKRAGTPLGLPACVEGSIEVTVAGLPNSPQFPYLEVWYSTGTGACNQADRATRVGTNQNCTKLTHSRESQQINSFAVLNTTVQIQPVCDLNSDKSGGSRQGPQTLWFLLLRSQGSAEAAQFYRAFTINIDTLPPEEPTNVEAGSGQTDIPLTWDLPLSSTNFYVIADYSEGAAVNDQDGGVADAGAEASGSSDCTSRYIRAGNRLDPNVKVPGLLIRETGSVSTEMSFDGRDFGGVKKVPVAVAAEDLAGNISVLSAVQCLTVTQTTGFWDRYKSPEGGGPGGVAEPGCACAVPGTRTSGPRAVLVTPAALLLVGAYARRRIRRRAR